MIRAVLGRVGLNPETDIFSILFAAAYYIGLIALIGTDRHNSTAFLRIPGHVLTNPEHFSDFFGFIWLAMKFK